MTQKKDQEKMIRNLPFTLSQKIIENSVIESVTKVNYNIDIRNEQMFGFTNSYIVFDYGGCDITEQNGKYIESPKIYIKPARWYYFNYNKNKSSSYVVVRLNPCSFYNITGLNAFENSFNYIDLSRYIDNTILEDLYNKFESLQTAEEITEYIYQKLDSTIRKWEKSTPIDAIMNDIFKVSGMLTVEDILSKYPHSMSTLNRYFKKYVGMTVGLYIRLVKFNTLIAGLYSNHVNLQDIIAQYNFYDQTHLTKDFKKFSGITPAKYKGPNHEILHQAIG
ncbi:hypothetical protein WH52_02540 [Tenacibaculum holothuriorum]|uniref:HTH araC/xylS-type domain-containing protein n=1 Tax=Tenacibaculum holothuriorum TaxID=1635173 RepID=A0A1Y2PH84_9FLAO|nr:helix-turn-helix transcriptional regulator [Tenacibaculum holothuriorum]OSY89530.1 hypothetical protein WH52_02540 [Tenacibaculum holothuriorum]